MSQLGWHLEDDRFVDDTPYGQKTFTNIVAVQNASAPRRLTLACHFDSKYFEDFEFIGATDSAVSCALMIDVARHLNDAFPSVRYSSYLQFVHAFYIRCYLVDHLRLVFSPSCPSS